MNSIVINILREIDKLQYISHLDAVSIIQAIIYKTGIEISINTEEKK